MKVFKILCIVVCLYTTSNSIDPADPNFRMNRIEAIQDRLDAIGLEETHLTREVHDLLTRVNDVQIRGQELIRERADLTQELRRLSS
ncbi:MAG: hypothetical protein P4L31_05450 [Candidatus Babeliales bacterium]|nr:hypothetical protein [Candidatus Babeliales bacterium]